MIEVCGLEVRYADVHALRGVDLSLPRGSFTLVAGPSGGGKSTLALALMGLIPQTIPGQVRGGLSVCGLDPRVHGVAEMAKRVGLVFQNPATQLFNGTVEEEVAFGPRNLGLPGEEVAARVQGALQATGCADLSRRAVRHLSSGQQQRVVIAAALAMQPAVLILDEPTANLDEEGVAQVVQVLVGLNRDRGVTIVVIEHRLHPFLPYADRLVWIADGRVVMQGPPDIVTRLQGPLAPRQPGPPSGCPALVALEGVSAGYNGVTVLENCSATIHRGDFIGLVGPNGAGKSTLARVLAGLHRPRRGRVAWYGRIRWGAVGLVQQNPLHQLVRDTVEAEVRFGLDNLHAGRDEDLERVLASMGLLGLRQRPTQMLSLGEQQRTVMAATLSLRPALLILDEPTIGQDWAHLSRLMDFLADLNRAGQTILMITHDGRLVEGYAGRLWRMADGRLQEAGNSSQGQGV